MKKAVTFVSLVLAGSILSWAIFYAPVSEAEESPEIILFTGENFTGNRVVLTNTVLDMPKGAEDGPEDLRGWNDTVGSIIVVSGTWRLFQHGRCGTEIDEDETPQDVVLAEKAAVSGWSCLVSAHADGPAEFPTPAAGGWESDVSSVQLVSQDVLPAWAVLLR